MAYKKIGEGENMAQNADWTDEEKVRRAALKLRLEAADKPRKEQDRLLEEARKIEAAYGEHLKKTKQFPYDGSIPGLAKNAEESKNSNEEDKKKMEYEEFKGHMNAYEKKVTKKS